MIENKINGATLYDLIHLHTGIYRQYLRITKGYTEIQPSRDIIDIKQGDKLEVKLRILGGGRVNNEKDRELNKGLDQSHNKITHNDIEVPCE